MKKIKSVNLDLLLNSLNNDDYVAIFVMGESYKDNLEFIRDLMIEKQGVYRISRVFRCLNEEMNKAKLVLFYSSMVQMYFGWGLLDDEVKCFNNLERVTNCNYGPYRMTDEVRKIFVSEYEDGILLNEEDKKYDKQFYKFYTTGLINFPFDKDDITCMDIIKEPPQSPLKIGKITDIDSFRKLLKREKVSINSYNLPKLPNSLIEQIDSYNIENVHTAFLKNFLSVDNIYGLGDKSIKAFVSLIVDSLLPYYDSYNKEDILNDTYEVMSQKRVKSEEHDIQPDLVLFGKKYRIIIEAKYYSLENGIQTYKYYKHYENESKDDRLSNIYVFLSLLPGDILSVEKKFNKKIYNRILFKDLVDKVYLNLGKVSNEFIFTDYLKSFILTANPDYGVDINYVPYIDIDKYNLISSVRNYYSKKECEKFFKWLIEKNIPDNCGIDFNNIKEKTLARYLLVILYNTSTNNDKKLIERIYTKLK